MSTRGTYKQGPYTVYIHHDNYLEGAAVKLYECFTKTDKGTMIERLIRTQPAELTKNHEQHSDTEFRYTFEQCPETRRPASGMETLVTVEAVGRDWETWQVVRSGTVCELIDDHPELIQPYEPFKRVEFNYKIVEWFTQTQAAAAVLEKIHTAAMWKKNAVHGANVDSLNYDIMQLIDTFPAINLTEMNAVYREHGEKAAKYFRTKVYTV